MSESSGCRSGGLSGHRQVGLETQQGPGTERGGAEENRRRRIGHTPDGGDPALEGSVWKPVKEVDLDERRTPCTRALHSELVRQPATDRARSLRPVAALRRLSLRGFFTSPSLAATHHSAHLLGLPPRARPASAPLLAGVPAPRPVRRESGVPGQSSSLKFPGYCVRSKRRVASVLRSKPQLRHRWCSSAVRPASAVMPVMVSLADDVIACGDGPSRARPRARACAIALP